MTSITTPAVPLETTPRPLATRVSAIVRLLFVNPWTAIFTPLSILGFLLLLNIGVLAVIRANLPPDGELGPGFNTGAFFVFVYMLVVAVQSVNRAFPLALGYGSTRRDFLVGFGVFAMLLSAGYALVLVALTQLELATGGWGVGLRFFAESMLGQTDWLPGFAFSVLTLILFFAIGTATAAVYVRWRTTGMYVFWAAVVVVVFGAIVLVSWLQAWGQVGDFFVTAGVLGSAAWSLVISGLCGIAAWFVLRRATP